VLGLIVLLQTLTLVVSGPASSSEYLPIWVAHADGHFKRQGLTVNVRATRSEVGAAEALAQGQADLVATSLEALLRFGARDKQSPRLLLGLTAAPPVALLVDTSHGGRVRTVEGLAGLRVGISAPGAAEHSWLHVLLARAGLSPAKVHVVSVGANSLERALVTGEVHAAMLPEPAVTRLLAAKKTALLADLRTPVAAASALGGPTVSAGIFVRADRRPGERELAAFTRGILAAQARLAAGRADELATRLPRSVAEPPAVFEARVDQAKTLYLTDGRVSAQQLASTAELLRDQLPLPARARVQLLPTQGSFKATPTR
jgi:NitT/TauT family transport system substrate-binding protein